MGKSGTLVELLDLWLILVMILLSTQSTKLDHLYSLLCNLTKMRILLLWDTVIWHIIPLRSTSKKKIPEIMKLVMKLKLLDLLLFGVIKLMKLLKITLLLVKKNQLNTCSNLTFMLRPSHSINHYWITFMNT
jgi:hypothetical protein